MIAALYVMLGGPYYGLDGVDPWGLPDRDAREYNGPWPVVAHPPCSSWCQLAFINQKRYGHKVGDDGGCFAHALDCVRQFGGVLEHPAYTHAWRAHGLPNPKPGRWLHYQGGAVTVVSQRAYGHRARKMTWLYACAPHLPTLEWSGLPPEAQISYCKNHGNSPLPRLSKREASSTPVAFRDVLLAIAGSVQQGIAA